MSFKKDIFDSVKHAIRVLGIALVVLHLVPVFTTAWAAVMLPSHEIRTITKDNLYLSDIFPTLPKEKDQSIGPAPLPGADIVLNARMLAKLAMTYGINWAPATTQDTVTLRRDAVMISPEDIAAALSRDLAARGETGKFELAFTSPPKPIALAVGTTPDIQITDLVYDAQTSQFHGFVAATAALEKRTMVAGSVQRLVEVPVAREGLEKGDVIAATDLGTIFVKESQIAANSFLTQDKLIGLSVRRTIAPNRIITPGDVEEPLFMKRGDKITLVYKTGTMELVAQGRAMQDGRMGDRVRIVNVDSNKNLQGTVTGDHQVAID